MKTCAHLWPLERAIAERGIVLDEIEAPYAGSGHRWYGCGCTFDADALRARLSLAACVGYQEYDGRVAGSDATFECATCRCVILGLHPRYAPSGTPRLA